MADKKLYRVGKRDYREGTPLECLEIEVIRETAKTYIIECTTASGHTQRVYKSELGCVFFLSPEAAVAHYLKVLRHNLEGAQAKLDAAVRDLVDV